MFVAINFFGPVGAQLRWEGGGSGLYQPEMKYLLHYTFILGAGTAQIGG